MCKTTIWSSFPAHLVQAALAGAPSTITLFDRLGQPALFLEGTNVYFGPGSDCHHILDSFTGERRKFTSQDVNRAVTLVDALPNMDFVMSMGVISDATGHMAYLKEYAAMLTYTAKPAVITADSLQTLKEIVDMASAAVGGIEMLRRKPVFLLYDEPISPLSHGEEAVDKLLFLAKNMLPTNYSPGMMAGATGPVTVAGAMVQANAEILAGLVMHQLQQPGAPFVYGAGMSPIDMGSMQPTYAAPEAVMSQAGLMEMARRLYHLPTWGFSGCSASKLCDEQAVYEAAHYLMMSAWMGCNVNHDVGYLEFGLTFSFDLMVMCDEMISHIRRMMEGIATDDESLGLEAIRRVGPGGNFLGDDHTFSHFRENWQPDLTDRRTVDDWKARGAFTMGQRAKEKIRQILDTHKPAPLSPQVREQMDRILGNAEKRS